MRVKDMSVYVASKNRERQARGIGWKPCTTAMVGKRLIDKLHHGTSDGFKMMRSMMKSSRLNTREPIIN